MMTEIAREISDRNSSPVNLAIVSCKEQVHVRAIPDHCLVKGVTTGDRSREERLRR